MDETAGTIESEIWSFAATVYSLLAGRSPFEQPGESNKSSDLISRINRAKPGPIGRSDVPVSLERALAKAMSRKPENRHESVLELVRELQAVETEIGVPQTAIEVVMDDWALATTSNLEDRTRLKGGHDAVSSVAQRRRRRRGEEVGPYSAVGTIVRETGSKTKTPATGAGKSIRALAWVLVAAAVLVVALGTTATLVLIRATSTDIPTVSDVQATTNADTVAFSWRDPGLVAGDSYQIITNTGESSIQRSPQFTVDAEPGDRVCITVTVNREGKTGASSSEKCADVPR